MRPDRLPAIFMRGGTSKGLMFLRSDLPDDKARWDELFVAAMGSPDPYGRQLNGMGGGISSLSKVCIVGKSTRPDADVDYTFGQVLVSEARVDYAGNCGNMLSAVGPFAVLRGLVGTAADGDTSLVVHNTNTGKLIRSTFPVKNGEPVFDGDFEIDGVSGGGAPIALDFLQPGGSKTGALLPTRCASETLEVDGLSVRATLMDAASPCVFVSGADLGMTVARSPEDLDSDATLLRRLEALRQQASLRMGLAATPAAAAKLASQPRIAVVLAPHAHQVLSGRSLAAADMDIVVRMISMGKPHRALPITGAICLATALRIPETLPGGICKAAGSPLRIAHPSGLVAVDAEIGRDAAGGIVAVRGRVLRTARRLFEGHVFC